MVGHEIASGGIESKGLPSSVSKEVVGELRNEFGGLIFTDSISMRGLRNKYILKEKEMFIDLIEAGNDIVIDSSKNPILNKTEKRIEKVIECIKKGFIDEKRIDDSVERILKSKGYKIL